MIVMNDVYQYGDLPQVPDERSPFWQTSAPGNVYFQSTPWNDPTGLHCDDDSDCNDYPRDDVLYAHGENEVHQNVAFSMLSSKLASTGFVHHSPFRGDRLDLQERHWTIPPCSHRNGSPDSTSVSGTSSYAAQNDYHSPHPSQLVMYKTPLDFPESYPTPETSLDGGYPAELDIATSSNTITMKDIEVHQQEHEPAGEEQHGMDMQPDYAYEQEPSYNEAPPNEGGFEGYAEPYGSRNAESVEPAPPNEESDSDYQPERKTRKRRSSASSRTPGRQGGRGRGRKSSTSSTQNRTQRVTKKSREAQPPLTSSRRTSAATAGGNNTQRPFPCPLAIYGCNSNFASKNEWKRHVSTQHIKLGFWRCDLCAIHIDPNDDHSVYHNDFNRKDLFTQHLRRMHAAPTNRSSKDTRTYPVDEDNIAAHQKRCYLTYRQTPSKSSCLFCPKDFAGSHSWDDRMEHVGKHLEKEQKGLMLEVSAWREDNELEQWLVTEGLIARDRLGQWKIGDGKPLRDLEDNSQDG